MFMTFSEQYQTPAVFIQKDENPSIKELIEYAWHIEAFYYNEEGGVDIVVDDRSGLTDRSPGAELYEEHTLYQLINTGQTTWRPLVS